MSAMAPIATVCNRAANLSLSANSGIMHRNNYVHGCDDLLDHLVGADKHRRRKRKPDRSGSFDIKDRTGPSAIARGRLPQRAPDGLHLRTIFVQLLRSLCLLVQKTLDRCG